MTNSTRPSIARFLCGSIAACILIVCQTLVGQSPQVVPASAASAEGDSFTSFPFGRSTAIRAQLAYGGDVFAARSMSIRRIAFRADGGRALARKGCDVEIQVSAIARSASLQALFASNRGRDHATLFARRRVDLPAIARANGPRSFAISFVLDRAYGFDPRNAGLLVEFVVHGQQSGRYELDLDASCTSARADFGAPGCAGSQRLVPVADCPTAALELGRAFTLRVSRLRPNDLAVGFLGTRETGMWQGLRLPASLAPFGAPGCTLNTDVTVAVGGVVDVRGELRLPGFVPAVASLTGAWLRFQGIGLDRGANALGLSLSQGSKVQVCRAPAVSRCIATTLSASSGSVDSGRALVTRFSSN